MTCPSCKGEGLVTVVACPGGRVCRDACSDCGGSGEISEQRAAWKDLGGKIRAFRLARDMSLREAARWAGIPPVEWSEAEHGKVDPDRVLMLARTIEITERSR